MREILKTEMSLLVKCAYFIDNNYYRLIICSMKLCDNVVL